MATAPGEDSNVCRICMVEVSDAASVKGCSHVFCYKCLHQWTSTRRNPLCPICRTAITALVLADGTEHAAQPATGDQQSEEPDLSCLDHNYFLGEVGRLLSRANSLHNRLYTEAYGCGRKGGGRQMQRSLDSIQDVLEVLSSYRSSLEDEERFDAEVLLQDLYRLDRQLTSAQAGGTHDAADAAVEAVDGWEEGQHHECDYLEEDYWHEDEEDDDHHDDHDWHKGLSRTPGRAPTSRHVTRNTRNSNSSVQQAQQQRRQQQQQQQSLSRGRGRG